MRTKQLGKTDLQVSVVSLGTWPMGGTTYGQVDDNESIRTIKAALDAGVNLIDTAPGYGNGRAEEVVGRAIKGHRDEVIIATKVGIVQTKDGQRRNLKPESIRVQIEDSLRRLELDTIDLYQIHWPDPHTPVEDSIYELVKLKEAGKFRYLGVSNFDPELMDRVIKIADLASLQPHYSLLRREIEAEILPYCRKHQIGILAYGSLGSGILAGKYRGKTKPEFAPDDTRHRFYRFFEEPMWSKVTELVEVLAKIADNRNKPISHVAINWLTQQDGVTTALVGARHPEQIVENAGAGAWTLSEEELSVIEQAYERIFNA